MCSTAARPLSGWHADLVIVVKPRPTRPWEWQPGTSPMLVERGMPGFGGPAFEKWA